MKQKFIDYFMDVAERTSQLSHAVRLKVGAIIVKDDRIISIGNNGMPSGWDNNCEYVFKHPQTKIEELEYCHDDMHELEWDTYDGPPGRLLNFEPRVYFLRRMPMFKHLVYMAMHLLFKVSAGCYTNYPGRSTLSRAYRRIQKWVPWCYNFTGAKEIAWFSGEHLK